MSSRSTFRKPNLLHPSNKRSYKSVVSSKNLVRRRNLMNAIRRKAELNRTMKISREGTFYMENLLSAIEETPEVKFTMPAKMHLALKRLGRKRQTKKQQKKKPVRK